MLADLGRERCLKSDYLDLFTDPAVDCRWRDRLGYRPIGPRMLERHRRPHQSCPRRKPDRSACQWLERQIGLRQSGFDAVLVLGDCRHGCRQGPAETRLPRHIDLAKARQDAEGTVFMFGIVAIAKLAESTLHPASLAADADQAKVAR